MAVDNINIIDFVSIDLYGNAVLTIADHLEWDDDNDHLIILQGKINSYLVSIEGGDLFDIYPNAKDRNIVISVAVKYPPNKIGQVFLNRVKETLEAAGYGFNLSIIS